MMECMLDPLLKRYSVVMVEDGHRRDMWTDVLIGVLAKVLKVRTDLRVIVQLATTNEADRYVAHFGGEKTGVVAVNETVVGSRVEVQYLAEPAADYVAKAVDTVAGIYGRSRDAEGDVIVFLANRNEFGPAASALRDRVPALAGVYRYPEERRRLAERRQETGPCAVLATSGTEDDLVLALGGDVAIRYVIDCGLTTVPWYDADAAVWTTVTEPVDATCAHLRARMASHQPVPGQCWRLYPESAALGGLIPATRRPEMHRCDLTEPVLRIMGIGIANVARSFPFVAPAPPAAAVAAALAELHIHGAVEPAPGDGGIPRLTRRGEKMAELPLPIPLARALCEAEDRGCVDELAAISAAVVAGGSLGNILVTPRDPDERSAAHAEHRAFMAAEGDHVTLLNIWRAFDASGRSSRWCRRRFFSYKALTATAAMLDRLRLYLGRLGIQHSNRPLPKQAGPKAATDITHCLATGYFRNVAKRTYRGFELATSSPEPVTALPSSSSVFHGVDPTTESLSSPWVIYESQHSDDSTLYISGISHIERDWLPPRAYRMVKD